MKYSKRFQKMKLIGDVMVTVNEILKKNNINLKLKPGLLNLDVGNRDYKFVDAYIEDGYTYRGSDYGEKTKHFNFVSDDGHKLVIYPDQSKYALWLTSCSCYYDENGNFLTELIF